VTMRNWFIWIGIGSSGGRLENTVKKLRFP
jgi:hypothetical protein